VSNACPFSCQLFRSGQFNFPGGAADATGWAHCVVAAAADCFPWANLIFREVRPMLQDGPIVFAAAAADCFASAILIFRQVLLMLQDGPIVFAAAATDCFPWANLIFLEVVPML
jgi:hypothetical protein